MQEIYPSEPTVSMTVQNRTNVLCGKRRPGHFDGVVTVLSKLFHITKADFAYFGMKDAQQVAVIQGLVEDLNFPIQIRPVPTVRENDGLARSSRNIYLSNQERKQAPHLYRSLKLAEQLIIDGEINPVIIIEEVKKIFKFTYGWKAGLCGNIILSRIEAYPNDWWTNYYCFSCFFLEKQG